MVMNGKTSKTVVKLTDLSVSDGGRDEEKSLKPIVLALGHLRGHKPNHPGLHVQTTFVFPYKTSSPSNPCH